MSQKSDPSDKRRYVAPKLTLFGSAAVLTAAGSMGGAEGSQSMNNPILMA
jgi:hypothetical protein